MYERSPTYEDHPNIIKFIDSVILNNELYIICEWAEKGDLKRQIREAIEKELNFSELNIWEFLHQMMSGINVMHHNRIMHRDLKPANILISNDGVLKIADQGLGRIFGSGTFEVFSKVGTPLYMSPELLKGEGYEMKSDVWSVGCMIYELAELKSPFRDDGEKLSLKELFDRISAGKYRPSTSKKYSPTLKDLIYSMINLEQKNRIDGEEVVKQCDIEIAKLKNSNKIDKSFIMEDIYFKLSLQNYEIWFCKSLKIRSISKWEFVDEEPDFDKTDKFIQFCKLVSWLCRTILNSKTCVEVKAIDITEKEDKKKMASDLIKLLKETGIKFSIKFTAEKLIHGFGDEVCNIINDLTTEILIRKNYEFSDPTFSEPAQGCSTGNDNTIAAEDDSNDDIDNDFINDSYEDEESSQYDGMKTHGNMSTDVTMRNTNNKFKNKNVIEPEVDPKEWYAECDDMRDDFLNMEEKYNFMIDGPKIDLPFLMGKKEDEHIEKKMAIDIDTISNLDYEIRNRQANHLLKQFKLMKYCIYDKNWMYRFVDKIEEDLKNIKDFEDRYQKYNFDQAEIYKEKQTSSDNLSLKIQLQGSKNKKLIDKYKDLKDYHTKISTKLDNKIENPAEEKILELRKSISSLKDEIKDMSVKNSIMQNSVQRYEKKFSQKKKEEILGLQASMIQRRSKLFTEGTGALAQIFEELDGDDALSKEGSQQDLEETGT